MTTYGARQSIYTVEQDHDTLVISFSVYGRVVSEEKAERRLSNKELYDLLVVKAQEYKEADHE